MASVVLTMNSPHQSEQNQANTSEMFVQKKKTRRAPKKQKKNKKPYYKLTWEEKARVNEQDRMKGEARLANSKNISAPSNTTQFLMQEHRTATPNQTPVGMNYDSDDDTASSIEDPDQNLQALESSGVFMENDFTETFDSMKADILETKTRSQLISEVVNLEKQVTELVNKERQISNESELQMQITKLQNENELLRTENLQLKGRGSSSGSSIPLTPIKDNLCSMAINENSNTSST